MTLHELHYGDHGPLLIFCHGLFGQGKNWGTVVRMLSEDYRCVLLDAPNHGRSPWTDVVDYPTMADVVADHLAATHRDAEGPLTFIGHSMGGKIAMRMALTRPDLIGRLVVADMAPAETKSMSTFESVFRALDALDLSSITSRAHADELLSVGIPDVAVRSLVMQSLRQDHGRWYWMLNLEGLSRDAVNLSAWPPIDAHFDKATLFITGAESNYVRREDWPTIKRLFPNSVKVALKGAGHWLHSQQPAAFAATLRSFLEQTTPDGGIKS